MDFSTRFDFNSHLVFANLSENEQAFIKERQELLHFSNGDKIFYEDGIPTGVYELLEGRVKKFKTVLDTQQQIFYIYTRGDLFGYHAVLSDERYQDSAEALDDVTVNFISIENFVEIIKAIPTIKDALLFNMAHEFGVLANIICVLSQKAQNVRLALFLMVMQNRFKKIDPHYAGVDLTREDLANIVGTSRESLSRSLNALKKQNLIAVDKRLITVIDEKRLESFIYD